MEWRQQTSVSCADAFTEAQRWIEEVTGKSFGCNDFRAALENGVLLCDLINQLKPGIIKRVNRLSTPIAGLDNVTVFLKACGKLGLNVSQLFHPGDLQDLSTRATLRRDESSRRLKNVLITIYWLGRKAHLDAFYSGPQLNFKAFEGLLGLALSKALDEGGNVFRDSWDQEKEEDLQKRMSFKMGNCGLSMDSVDPRALRPNSEGCGSDAEAEQVFKMEITQPSTQQNRAYIPPPLPQRKQGQEGNGVLSRDVNASEEVPVSSQPLVLLPTECSIDDPFLQALCEEDSEDDYTDADPLLDDLYFRRMQQTLHQTSTNANCDRFLPQYWTPEEETRVRTIYLGSQKRPWYHEMLRLSVYQTQVKPERPVQVNPGWIWSKSLSDIPMVYPMRKVPEGHTITDHMDGDADMMAQEWSHDNKRKCSVAAKDSEAQWQDDLTKWKNRRRSTKSDARRKSQDRDHVISQMVNGVGTTFDRNGAQGGLLKGEQQSPCRHNPAPRPYSTSPPSKSSSLDLKPRTRALLVRSYATEAPYYSPTVPLTSSHSLGSSGGSMPVSDGIIPGEETHLASLASDGAGVTTPTPDCSFSSKTPIRVQGSLDPFQPTSGTAQSNNAFTNQISTLTTTLQPVKPAESTSNRVSSYTTQKVPAPCPDAEHQAGGFDPLEDFSHHNHGAQKVSQQTLYEPAVETGQGQQGAGSYKYFSQAGSWSGSASLPRGYRRSEGSSRLSSAITARPFGNKQSRVSSLPRLCNVDNNQSLLMKCERDEHPSPPAESSLKRQTATAHLKGPFQTTVTQRKETHIQQNGKDQREEVKGVAPMSQKSFQTSTYHHQLSSQTQQLPQPFSNHNRGCTLPSNTSTDGLQADHSDMRVSLTLKPNSRPDFGFQTRWDSTGARVKFIQPGSPAEQCQLCVDDEIVAINGVTVAQMNYTQWMDKMSSSLQTGSLTMDIRRYGNKDWSSSEGGHHNQPGQSRMTLNLTTAAPILIGYPDHHANSGAPSDTTGNVSKLNGQSDNVMQGKVMNGEHADSQRTARSKGGSESAISDLQVPSISPSSSSWSWDHEEDRRRQEKWQEEQERLLQEQYQRDQERLDAEWRRAQQDAVVQNPFASEMTNGDGSSPSTLHHVNGLTNKTREEQQSPERRQLTEAGSKTQSDSQGPQRDKINEQAWAEDSCSFAQLSPAHRAKSLSTPALGGLQKQMKSEGRKSLGHSVSQVEKERQQILEEMKKRTHLLTDNSWIRQRSSSVNKEPVYIGVPLKRYESLDNLNTFRQSPILSSTFSFPRPHSAAAGYCAPTRFSSSRYNTGSVQPQRNAAMDSTQGRISGRRTCSVCERLLGSGAAMVIETLNLCFHLTCFQCVGCQQHLGGTETGVQVRVRNRKPYCEPCYFQIKSPPM